MHAGQHTWAVFVTSSLCLVYGGQQGSAVLVGSLICLVHVGHQSLYIYNTSFFSATTNRRRAKFIGNEEDSVVLLGGWHGDVYDGRHQCQSVEENA